MIFTKYKASKPDFLVICSDDLYKTSKRNAACPRTAVPVPSRATLPAPIVPAGPACPAPHCPAGLPAGLGYQAIRRRRRFVVPASAPLESGTCIIDGRGGRGGARNRRGWQSEMELMANGEIMLLI